jgi:hypothetical protein
MPQQTQASKITCAPSQMVSANAGCSLCGTRSNAPLTAARPNDVALLGLLLPSASSWLLLCLYGIGGATHTRGGATVYITSLGTAHISRCVFIILVQPFCDVCFIPCKISRCGSCPLVSRGWRRWWRQWRRRWLWQGTVGCGGRRRLSGVATREAPALCYSWSRAEQAGAGWNPFQGVRPEASIHLLCTAWLFISTVAWIFFLSRLWVFGHVESAHNCS